MEPYHYLIIGGGMSADAAVRGIRELDMSGRIGIISSENFPPYFRPPLTKALWFGKEVDEIWCRTEDENVLLHLERTITEIHPETHTVTDVHGETYWYKKLLLATGGSPKRLEGPDEGVIYLRTLRDYHNIRQLYANGAEFIVIGSGFIGTEIAAALTMNGKKVTMLFEEWSIGQSHYPSGLSQFLNSYYKEKGIELMPGQHVISVTKENERFRVETQSGDIFHADGVIAGLGITPNTELAEKTGLAVENGITVDRYLQSSLPDIYAAGDVANFYSPHLEKRIRIEHEDAALSLGRVAGKNMAGAKEHYTHLPFYYTDLFELGFEAIGEIDARFEIVEDWHELYRKGVLYYLEEGRLRGALLVGIWNQIPSARELIASKEQFTADALLGKITA